MTPTLPLIRARREIIAASPCAQLRPRRASWWSVLSLLVAGLGCDPAAPAQAPPGPRAIELTVRTDPPGALVTIDGAPAGAAPVTVRLNPGPHRVRASMSGYYPTPETRVQVGAFEPRDIVLSLVASH